MKIKDVDFLDYKVLSISPKTNEVMLVGPKVKGIIGASLDEQSSYFEEMFVIDYHNVFEFQNLIAFTKSIDVRKNNGFDDIILLTPDQEKIIYSKVKHLWNR